MRAIKIDAENSKMYDITIGEGWKEIPKALHEKAEYFQPVRFTDNTDLIVDEEGLFKDYGFGFKVNGVPFVGNGILLSVAGEDYTDVYTDADSIDIDLEFVQGLQVRL